MPERLTEDASEAIVKDRAPRLPVSESKPPFESRYRVRLTQRRHTVRLSGLRLGEQRPKHPPPEDVDVHHATDRIWKYPPAGGTRPGFFHRRLVLGAKSRHRLEALGVERPQRLLELRLKVAPTSSVP